MTAKKKICILDSKPENEATKVTEVRSGKVLYVNFQDLGFILQAMMNH